MRLRASGSRQEIRETYMPMLASKIVSPLTTDGAVNLCGKPQAELVAYVQAAVEDVISYMDEYYLGKEDWDAFVELGVDTMKDDLILKKIPTAVKTAFTRQ
jgi:replication factor C subunit 1